MATFESEMEPKPQSKGCGTKVLVILGIVFVVLAVVCCGGAGILYYMIKPTITEDPAEVRAKTAEIAAIEIPDQLEPTTAMSMKIPLNDIGVTMVTYTDEDTGGFLSMSMLAAEGLAPGKEAEMRRGFEQMTNQQNVQGPENIEATEESEVTMEIRGETATFTISKGAGQQSGGSRIAVVGTFQGKEGPTVFVLNVDAEQFSEEEVIEMLESIK